MRSPGYCFLFILSLVACLGASLLAGEACASGTGYVYAYFKGPWPTGGHSGVYLSYSSDGLNFAPLNDDNPVFVPPESWGPGSDTTTSDEDQTRDPSVVYGPDGYFHMVWTSGITTRSIGYARSADLKTWTNEQRIDIWSPETLVDNTWAPEVFYDEANSRYQIIFASDLDDGDHKLYSITTTDFTSFSAADAEHPYFYNGETVIDAMLAYDAANDQYLMAVKDEQNGQKNIRLAIAPTAQGPWSTNNPIIVGPGSGIENNVTEGPSIVRVGNAWHLYYDAYGAQYLGVATTTDADPTNAGSWVNRTGESTMPFDPFSPVHHGTVFAAPTSAIAFEFLPYSRSDLTGDNDITAADWLMFSANHLADNGIGDLDNDGDNDFADFRLFESDYEAHNGPHTFAPMVASLAVPEPTTWLLCWAGVPALFSRRLCR